MTYLDLASGGKFYSASVSPISPITYTENVKRLADSRSLCCLIGTCQITYNIPLAGTDFLNFASGALQKVLQSVC